MTARVLTPREVSPHSLPRLARCTRCGGVGTADGGFIESADSDDGEVCRAYLCSACLGVPGGDGQRERFDLTRLDHNRLIDSAEAGRRTRMSPERFNVVAREMGLPQFRLRSAGKRVLYIEDHVERISSTPIDHT